MSSQASWQTGASDRSGADWSEEFPDRQSVEGLLRRLVRQVEETERRYGEALSDLQGRLDQLALTTGAARVSAASDDSATLDRLHDQVSGLARRFEREAATSLDDFERLGQAVLGGLDRSTSGLFYANSIAPSAFVPQPSFPLPPLPDADHDLSKRLVEMAERLEQSVDSAMAPKTVNDLTARVEAMARQIAAALAALPSPVSLAPIERQIADIGHKLDHAEGELVRIGAIETALYRLIERVDGQAGQLGDMAAKAATEAARLVLSEAKFDAATAERLDAMHRDLKAMNERSTAAGDRLAGIVETVHDSLKQLVQQAERSAAPSSELKSAVPFVQDAPQSHKNESEPARSAEQRAVEPRSTFGRAPVAGSGDRPADRGEEKPAGRDAPRSVRILAKRPTRTETEMEEDLVAAARRAAQAAARRAAERPGATMAKWTPADAQAPSRAEPVPAEAPFRRGRPLLVISAAVLLVLSAILLYSRLHSKAWPELLTPAAEQSAPPVAAPTGNSAPPNQGEQAPAASEPQPEAPPPSPSILEPDAASNATRDTASGESENFTDIAKSSSWPATVVEEPADKAPAPLLQGTTQAKPAALQEVGEPELPPGVVFTVEDPARVY
jgi:localization factor PodJL